MANLQELLFNTPAMESLTAGSVLATMLTACLCGAVIYIIYRFFNNSPVYSPNFNLLIVMVCCVTAFVIITIGSNLVLSLGMVGALSIVRFRAAVKDPLDVGFLFWGVAAGLTSGARLYATAILGTACIALIYILFFTLRMEKRSFLLIVRYAPADEAQIAERLKAVNHKLKNKTTCSDYTELTAEVRLRKNDDGFIKPLTDSPECISAVLVEYTGDYT